MTSRDFPPLSRVLDSGPAVEARDDSASRLRRILEKHYDFVWRTLRFHGVPDATAEDAAQRVFCIVARRLGDIALGAEVSFVFVTAIRVASEARRALRRRPEAALGDLDALEASLPSAEELIDERRARAVLQEVLDAMEVGLRTVFVLYEIEEFTIPAIASMLGLREGTAASRLRRGREEFASIVKRRKAAQGGALRGVRP